MIMFINDFGHCGELLRLQHNIIASLDMEKHIVSINREKRHRIDLSKQHSPLSARLPTIPFDLALKPSQISANSVCVYLYVPY